MIPISPNKSSIECVPKAGWGFIYMYVLDDHKRYIGQTVIPIKRRHSNHMSAKKGCPFDNALRKHSYTLEILDYLPENELDDAESYYIDAFNTLFPNGWNFETGGNNGKHHSPETIKKLSELNMGENNPMYGKKLSAEHRIKLSECSKGENNPNYGRKHTDEAKQKIREARLGIPLSEETRKKISERFKGNKYALGYKHTNETKSKMRESHLGKGMGGGNPLARPIVQYSTDGKFISRYDSIADAARKYGVTYVAISRCCSGLCKTSVGYKWKYAE